MELRALIGRIGATYDCAFGQDGEAQNLLRQAPEVLSNLLPASMKPDASGGKGNAAIVPWIAVFHPDETLTAQRGMYVVYLFSADMSTVTLSLNQGVTELVSRLGTTKGRGTLVDQASAIREKLPKSMTGDLEPTINLRSGHALPRHYEAGNIVARTYQLSTLPDEHQMVADLHRFVRLYELALEVRTALRLSTPSSVVTTMDVQFPQANVEFKPKSDADYVQYFKEHTVQKRRDHERVVRQYGNFLREQGYIPNTNVHPRDLTALRGRDHWLIEVKVVYRGDGVQATRDALSQLLMYREFLYPSPAEALMLAVFSEDIGDRNVQFLEHYEIASVWKYHAGWEGSPIARRAGLTTAAPCQ